MSTKDEKIRAMQNAERFLLAIAHGGYKRIPKSLRDIAYSIHRHYPGRAEIEVCWKETGEAKR